MLQKWSRWFRLHFSLPFQKENDQIIKSKRLVISLTSIPSRLNRLKPTINSLVHQSIQADEIALNLPLFNHREKKDIEPPAYLKDYSNLVVYQQDKDWGPAQKLLPTLEREAPDTLIIYLDDDNIYPYKMVETFLKNHNSHSNQALGFCGRNLLHDLTWPFGMKSILGQNLSKSETVDILMGCGAVLVQPQFFNKNILCYENAPKESFYVDDIWINSHLLMNKIPRKVIPLQNDWAYLPSLFCLNTLSLDQNENRTARNNNVVISYFKDYWNNG